MIDSSADGVPTKSIDPDSEVAPALRRITGGYLDHLLIERGLSANTIAAYRRDLLRYTQWLTVRGIDSLEQVATADLHDYQRILAAGDQGHRPLAAASIARAVVAVRNLHAFGEQEGVTSTDVAELITPPKLGKRLPKALSVDDVQRLLDGVERETPLGLRDAALLELLYGTGARISEIVCLDVDDLSWVLGDPEAGLRLIGKGNKQRVVPLGSYARAAVDAWLVRGRPALLVSAHAGTAALLVNQRGGRLSRQSAWAALRQRAQQAGLPAEISPHSLRHSFATHLLDGGADIRVVQELLGHSSVTTTQIYTEVTIEHLRDVYAASHPRARGAK